jgi:hypothetical protein
MATKARRRSVSQRRTSAPQLTAAQREERRKAAREKAQAALERLDEAVAQIIENDDSFREYLRLSARMYAYSWRNRLLIWLQRPDAGMVAGFHRWRELERPVLKGAKGIQILAPCVKKIQVGAENAGWSTADGEVDAEGNIRKVVGFRVAYVFSVHDTAGDPIALPRPVEVTDDSDEARDILAALLARSEQLGVPVSFVARSQDAELARGAHGYFVPAERRIVVSADLPAAARAKTLAHELAHFVAGHKVSDGDTEAVAEGAAFVVAAHFGLDTASYSAPYIAGWAQDVGRVQRLLGHIADVAGAITDTAASDRCATCGTTYEEYQQGHGCPDCR